MYMGINRRLPMLQVLLQGDLPFPLEPVEGEEIFFKFYNKISAFPGFPAIPLVNEVERAEQARQAIASARQVIDEARKIVAGHHYNMKLFYEIHEMVQSCERKLADYVRLALLIFANEAAFLKRQEE